MQESDDYIANTFLQKLEGFLDVSHNHVHLDGLNLWAWTVVHWLATDDFHICRQANIRCGVECNHSL